MNNTINTIDDFLKITHKLPTTVLLDIDKRIGDWLGTGGTYEDSYMQQQFRYAERVLEVCVS